MCRKHGVGALLSWDRDFSRFPWLPIIDLEEEPRELPQDWATPATHFLGLLRQCPVCFCHRARVESYRFNHQMDPFRTAAKVTQAR